MAEQKTTLPAWSEKMDAVDVHALLAIMRLSLAVPGVIDSDYFDEIGRPLFEITEQIASCQAASEETETIALPAGLEKARTVSAYEAYSWLGRQLSDTPDDLRSFFEAIQQHLEQRCKNLPLPLLSSAALLGELFEFNPAEIALLTLAAVAEKATIGLECLKSRQLPVKLFRALGAVVDAAPERVRDALCTGSRLAHSGLLSIGKPMHSEPHKQLALSAFGEICFQRPVESLPDLVKALVADVTTPNGVAVAWPEPTPEQKMAETMVANALRTDTAGVNILLHGVPAAGKTTFARFLLQSINAPGFMIPASSDAGTPLKRSERMARLHAVLRLPASTSPFALLIDEADDLLKALVPGSRADSRNDTDLPVQWKRLLQDNARPIIWVCRDPEEIDPAILANFALCVRFDRPCVSVRTRLATHQLLPAGVTDTMIAAVARHRHFSPELIRTTARVALLSGEAGAMRDEAVLCHLNGHVRALGQPLAGGIAQTSIRFNQAFLRIDGRFTAEQVMQAVVRNGAGTVLMNGPPGTGKTQFAKQIAERLGREMVYVTASDINTKWHGESERNVASIFTRCNPDEQIIFVDEAETVLAARESATHRATVSVTAEFLRQLEPFTGVFLCATNHLKSIDGALIRRFTFRLDFRALTELQREAMLREMTAVAADVPFPEECRQALRRLDGLTPGDFANVKRRFTLLNHEATLADWLLELRQEWLAKPDRPSGNGIGFA